MVPNATSTFDEAINANRLLAEITQFGMARGVPSIPSTNCISFVVKHNMSTH